MYEPLAMYIIFKAGPGGAFSQSGSEYASHSARKLEWQSAG